MDFNERTKKERIVFHGSLLKLKELDVLLANGVRSKREIVEHPGAVAILPITNDGHLVLIRQFRKACESILWEIPAGKLEKDEEPLVCAIRELEEETGYIANNWLSLGQYYTSPGYSNEILHLYLATDLIAGKMNLDQDEYLETSLFTRAEVEKLINEKQIKDMKTICALLFFQLQNNFQQGNHS